MPGRRKGRAAGQGVAAGRAFDPQDRGAGQDGGLRTRRAVPRRRQQGAGMGVGGGAEQIGGGALFDDAAALHDRDPVRCRPHDGKVVGDEQQRHPLVRDQPPQQIHDLRLRGHVERGGGFVRDQHVGRVGDGHGDRHALALAARQLVREQPQREPRAGQADAVEPQAGDAGGGVAVHAVVADQHLGHLIADGHQRIQGRHRFLEDHPDPAAAQVRHPSVVQHQQVPPVQIDPAGGARAVGQEPHDRQRRHRLARPAFADKPGDPPRRQGQRHVVQHRASADGD